HQLAQTRAAVANSQEAVAIADVRHRVLFVNDAFTRLARRPDDARATGDEMPRLFSEPERVRQLLVTLADDRHAWRGQLELATGDGASLPVTVRAEVVPARDGSVLGFFLIVEDLSHLRRAAAARQRLEQSLAQVGLARQAAGLGGAGPDALMGAVLANASVAAMDIADGAGPAVAGLIEEIENSTQRAASIYSRMRIFSDGR
ncbi:MAG: PAS domain-containing protein, partial [Comamonadaceae bacterium]